MFGRRRKRRKAELLAPPPAPPAIQLSEEQLFEVVSAKVTEFMGAEGSWTLVRRDETHTDSIFQVMASDSLARDITASILGNQVAVPHEPIADDVLTLPSIPRDVDTVQQVEIELKAIAIWADPQRHDPAYVDPALVSPPSSPRGILGLGRRGSA